MSIQQHVSSIDEYKRSAFLKHCNVNGINKFQFEDILISNNVYGKGLFQFFI